MTRELFEQYIDNQIANITGEHIDLIAREVHRAVGGYPPAPDSNHRMATCCSAMYGRMDSDSGDEVISAPPKGKSTTLTIRYYRRGR